MNTNRAYLLISGRLYLTTGDCSGCEPGNLYPVALGDFGGTPADLPGGALVAAQGDYVQLFGRRYEVNDLRPGMAPDADPDEINLELVYLTHYSNPEPVDE